MYICIMDNSRISDPTGHPIVLTINNLKSGDYLNHPGGGGILTRVVIYIPSWKKIVSCYIMTYVHTHQKYKRLLVNLHHHGFILR